MYVCTVHFITKKKFYIALFIYVISFPQHTVNIFLSSVIWFSSILDKQYLLLSRIGIFKYYSDKIADFKGIMC